jgi:hypothetical protein
MPTEAFDATDVTRRNMLKPGEWTLCVGAGICSGIIPDWATVTQKMLSRAYKTTVVADEVRTLTQNLGWSLDSLLQNALNTYQLTGRTLNDFNEDLSSELYGGILADASVDGLGEALSKLLSDPFSRDPRQMLQLEAFLSSKYPRSSLMQLARVLLRAKRVSRNPNSVLTFNADVLLHTALTLLQIRESASSTNTLSPDFYYRALYRSTDRAGGKIPIYHIHGSITPESRHREAREKLIFPESSYSELAASIYAWPQTVFLATAQSSRMVFVGLSMSDPNIRRWLSWCDGYRRDEISQHGSFPTFSSQHLWITTHSADPRIQRVKETGLLHLGVRTAFIPSWDALENALTNLAGT